MIFTLEGIQKLTRKVNDVFLCKASLHTIHSWSLPSMCSVSTNNDLVVISYDHLMEWLPNRLQITNPRLLYHLPSGDDADEYPILFVACDDYLPQFCENVLLSNESINRLIEKNDKISVNSTKLMTYRSFRDILNHLNDLRVDRSLWPGLCTDLVEYFQSLIVEYPYLNYLPVAERKSFRKHSIADSGFAWEMYIRFFIEEWSVTQSKIEIPHLKRHFLYEGWSGDFFSRENPLWKGYLRSNGQFLFNNSARDSIYQIWKEWIQEPK